MSPYSNEMHSNSIPTEPRWATHRISALLWRFSLDILKTP